MCGRFAIYSSLKALKEDFSVDEIRAETRPNYNVAPTQVVPVILKENPIVLGVFRWGLIPFWAKDEKIGYREL